MAAWLQMFLIDFHILLLKKLHILDFMFLNLDSVFANGSEVEGSWISIPNSSDRTKGHISMRPYFAELVMLGDDIE